jgi:hypothetical protein
VFDCNDDTWVFQISMVCLARQFNGTHHTWSMVNIDSCLIFTQHLSANHQLLNDPNHDKHRKSLVDSSLCCKTFKQNTHVMMVCVRTDNRFWQIHTKHNYRRNLEKFMSMYWNPLWSSLNNAQNCKHNEMLLYRSRSNESIWCISYRDETEKEKEKQTERINDGVWLVRQLFIDNKNTLRQTMHGNSLFSIIIVEII